MKATATPIHISEVETLGRFRNRKATNRWLKKCGLKPIPNRLGWYIKEKVESKILEALL